MGRLKTIRMMLMVANDPRVSDATREKADRLIRHIDALNRGPRRRRKRIKLPALKPLLAPLIASSLWISLFATRAYLASARFDECWDELSGAQQDICLRHAMEGRDEAIMIALGGPIVLIITLMLYRHLKPSSR